VLDRSRWAPIAVKVSCKSTSFPPAAMNELRRWDRFDRLRETMQSVDITLNLQIECVSPADYK
jgi:hypothetical protein